MERDKPTALLQLAPKDREAEAKPLPETLPSWRTSLVARATKMIPSSSSFSVSELSLSSSSDSTVKITAAGQGQELSLGGQPSSCFLVLHKAAPCLPSLPRQSPPLAEAPAFSSGCFGPGLGGGGLRGREVGLQNPRRQAGQAESSKEAMREVTLSSCPSLSSQPQIPSTENPSIWRAGRPINVQLILVLQVGRWAPGSTHPSRLRPSSPLLHHTFSKSSGPVTCS